MSALSLWAPVAPVMLLAAVAFSRVPRAQQSPVLGDSVLRISAARGQVAVAPSGDQVANHSYSHSDFQPPTEQEISDELNSTSDLIRAALGGDCYFSDYFHFPRRRSNCFAMGEVREHGFGVAGLNIYPVNRC
ncbi:MAG: polysaccharide deacetylase family protein [Myxococcota bacterium]|nr:polysaccharide deacetylase family protein [Myxococcota bacterium]